MLADNEFGLDVKTSEGGGRYTDYRMGLNLHKTKAVAGRLFHSDNVLSVCVYDCNGIARLYLKHCACGCGTVIREERDANGNTKV